MAAFPGRAARSGRTTTTRLLRAGLIAALGAATLPAAAAGFDANAFNALVQTFRDYGFEVVSTHERCLMERNLFGLYLRGTRRIVVCPRGNQLDTLMHEGWHAVQARCRHGQPLLSNEYLRANLSRADLRDIDALYSAKSWHREAEARAMALQKMPLYLAHLESSCGKPAAPGTIARPQGAPGPVPAGAPATAPAGTTNAGATRAAAPSAAQAPTGTASPVTTPAPQTPVRGVAAPSGATPSPSATLQQLLPVLLR